MSVETMTVADFLLARIAEDEADARQAQFNNGRWHRTGEWARATSVARDFGPEVVPERVGSLAWDDNTHIARWDPARVLAECDAKRRIIGEHPARYPYSTTPECERCEHFGESVDWPCLTLRLLAVPFADHPDYRQEWAPLASV